MKSNDSTNPDDSISELDYAFVDRLIDIWDDREFVIGMLSIATHDADKKKLIEFIDAGIDVDVETVTVYALDLADEWEEGSPSTD